MRARLDDAVFWRRDMPGHRDTPLQAIRRVALRLLLWRYLALYHAGWGRAGDRGLVAEVEGRPVGAVWYRFFTDASHGDGYVDAETPELAIAVVRGHRGQGIGRALLEAIAERARRDGLRRLGLSVERGNPAKELYRSVGYADYTPDDRHGRMILELAPQR